MKVPICNNKTEEIFNIKNKNSNVNVCMKAFENMLRYVNDKSMLHV